MKIVQVIHGYPPRYNAGSEVYTQGLCQALAARHEVHVFTRQENAFLPEYAMAEDCDPTVKAIRLYVINMARTRDRYRSTEVDERFGDLLDSVQPHIVHVGHLNHLSTSLVFEARRRRIPVLFTLHDYWLMCPRGQFIQMYPEQPGEVWAVCDGQQDEKCARRCYPRYFSGAPHEEEPDVAYWTGWVHRRMAHAREICKAVDLFIAPSRYLLDRFLVDFGLPENRLIYLDYGFHRERLLGRHRASGEPFTFGYIGTHIPAKGVHHLIEAFGGLSGDAVLRIWGRHLGVETASLQAAAASLPAEHGSRVHWMGEYRNEEIVSQVFNRCDAIVVPSIWAENSPLVIHEALQARLPVITADYGGMAEYVRHEQNGLLFTHRGPHSLAAQMQRFVDSPDMAQRLGARGYLQSDSGDVVSMEGHARLAEECYERVLRRKRER